MSKIVATYPYTDEAGTVLYENVRFEPKDFRPRRPDGNRGWIWNLDGTRRVLYRLPELLQAPRQDWVCFTEGEKDCDGLRRLGFAATTSGNATSWQDEFAEHFRGRLVAVFGDNDEAGQRYVKAVTKSLAGVAAEVRIVSIPDLQKGGDISDFIETHDALDDADLRIRIQSMIDAAEPVSANELPPERIGPAGAAVLATTRLADVQPREVVWFWRNRFVDWAFNLLSGDPGATKSYLSVFMAAVVSRGDCWPDCPDAPVRSGSVLLCSSEDDLGIVRARLDAHGADPKKVFVCQGVKTAKEKQEFDLNCHLSALERFMGDTPDMRLIVLDPVTAYLGQTNANSNAEVRGTLGPLAELAARQKVTIIGINHHNKRQDLSFMYRGLGSTGFVAQARSVWAVIEDKDDPDTHILAPIKANYSIKPSGLKYRIIDGAVAFEPDPWTGRLDDQCRSKESKTRVEECATWLADRLKQGAALSTTLFEESKQEGFNRDLCYRAKERLSIKATKDGFGGQWFWRLSDEE